MSEIGVKWRILRSMSVMMLSFALASVLASAQRNLREDHSPTDESDTSLLLKVSNFLWQSSRSAYQHVWPDLKFGWQIVVGTFVGFLGAAFGSVGGVGGGGIFVPMLRLIVGFDAKSATALSKCMIVGVSTSTFWYSVQQRHPTLDMPLIDYDLALLIQPMLMLGISIGVTSNVLLADWMITVLLIVLFLTASIRSFGKGIATWNKETIMKQEAAKVLEANGANTTEGGEYKILPGGPSNGSDKDADGYGKKEVSLIENVRWKECTLVVLVWVIFLALQIAKTYTSTCSTLYWVFNLTQIPVSFGVSLYAAIGLYKGTRTMASKGADAAASGLKIHQLILYCSCGIFAGLFGGLLGLGGGFILGPLFLELGIIPQVSSATATFIMMFSSSMCAAEYYMLNRFPVPYALYFLVVATIATIVGQLTLRKIITILGRASLIIFILASIIFVSAISLGGVGISNIVYKIEHHEYMGFENLCESDF